MDNRKRRNSWMPVIENNSEEKNYMSGQSFYQENFKRWRVIAVAGTHGKTTVSSILHGFLNVPD